MNPIPGTFPTGGNPLPDGLETSSIKKAKKNKKAGKGAETLFRTTMSNHMRLSEMADRKANLMISINTIIVSITISAYARHFNAPASLLWPSVLLLTVSLITIVVSLIATNPTIAPLRGKRDVVIDTPVDLLFFGSYTKLTADEYRTSLRALLTNDGNVYDSLIDNLYAQGKVLSRKYRLLKFAYQFFMIGFSVAVVSVVIVLITMYTSR